MSFFAKSTLLVFEEAIGKSECRADVLRGGEKVDSRERIVLACPWKTEPGVLGVLQVHCLTRDSWKLLISQRNSLKIAGYTLWDG